MRRTPSEGTPTMLRRLSLLAVLSMAAIFSANGCRSCSSCYDYSKPVANCECDACGTHRCGSAYNGSMGEVCGCNGGCATGGCTVGGCSSGHCGWCRHANEGYVEES